MPYPLPVQYPLPTQYPLPVVQTQSAVASSIPIGYIFLGLLGFLLCGALLLWLWYWLKSRMREWPERKRRAGSGAPAQINVSFNLTTGESLRVTVESVEAGTQQERGGVYVRAEGTDQASVASLTVSPPSINVASLEQSSPTTLPPLVSSPFPDLGEKIRQIDIPARVRRMARHWPYTMATTLFLGALVVYLATRLISLPRFPIYFFSDEAVQTLYAQDLISHHFRDPVNKITLPIYVEADSFRWTPLLPMYIQALTLSLFGKSIVVTRATSALISTLAALSVGMILKQIFKLRFWWVGVFLVTLIPAWFLHSRTAFETVMTTAFYGGFLWCYLLYRCKSPRYIFAALILGAMAFYTYSNGQIIMVAVGIFLLLSDLRYHLKQWRVLLLALLLLVVLALPLIVFYTHKPAALGRHLRVVDSYWYHAIPLREKIDTFIHKYTYALSPGYWFLPNTHDLSRHRMAGTGHIWIGMGALCFLGGLICLWRGVLVGMWRGLKTLIKRFKNWRRTHRGDNLELGSEESIEKPAQASASVIPSAAYRIILLAAMAVPVGASLADIGITRVLAFIVPAAILAGLGLETLINFIKFLFSLGAKDIEQEVLEGDDTSTPTSLSPSEGSEYSSEQERKPNTGRWGTGVFERRTALALFVILTIASFVMMNTAFTKGPSWFDDYGLYGMQYGAQQIFGQAVPEYLNKDPNVRVIVSSTWANGTDKFIRFFLTTKQQGRVQMGGIETYLFKRTEITPNDLFVFTPSEYQKAITSPKFQQPVTVEKILNYPDGNPGFYFIRLAYVDNVDDIFAAEKEARQVLQEGTALIGGQQVRVRYSVLDMGSPDNMFDGDRDTLIRGMEANPFILEFDFPQPLMVDGLTLDLGAMDAIITAKLYSEGSDQPVVVEQTFKNVVDAQVLKMDFEQEIQSVIRIRLEIKSLVAGESANIHIRELRFLPLAP